jgi:hypothetical protein
LKLLDEGLDAETLHQLLVEQGPDLLDASVPYLVVAAKHRSISAFRRDARRVELEERHSITHARGAGPFAIDPADIVVARSELAEVVEALGQLDPRYSWPLWWHAAGFSDDEIVALWNDAGFQPPNPSLPTLRKRRERARVALSRLIQSDDGSTDREPNKDGLR